MSKILSIILIALIVAVILFVANLFSDLLFILYKKASKKIRAALGLPVKDEPKNEEPSSDEESASSNSSKNAANDILQKILAKRKNNKIAKEQIATVPKSTISMWETKSGTA